MKRTCPTCGEPAVSALRLFSLGGLRRAQCAHCGARIGLSWRSSLVLLTLGTWLPVAGGIAGAMATARISTDAWPIGGVAGALVASAAFGVLYFRGATLVPSTGAKR